MNGEETADSSLERPLTVAELLEHEVLAGAHLVAGDAGLNRTISAVNVMSVPEIGQWVRNDEFLLATGFPLPRDDAGQGVLLEELHRHGVAGIGIKLDQYTPRLSEHIIAVAAQLGMPLVVIPEHIRFDDILSDAFTTIVNRQASALARAQEIHSSFVDISLSGGGLAELARRLSLLLGDASVRICDPQGSVLSTFGDDAPLADLGLLDRGGVDVSRLVESGLHKDDATGRRWAAREIRAGNLHHGYVVAAESAASFGEFSRVAVDQAAIVAALEVTRDLAVGAVEQRFSSSALFELISHDSEFADTLTRVSAFGWDLDRDIVVLVGRKGVASDDDAPSKRQSRRSDEHAIEFWTSAVRRHDRSAAAAGLGSELVAVMGADNDSVAVARSIQAEVAQFTLGQYAIGLSRTHPGPSGISVAYEEARMALRLGYRVSGAGAVTAFGELGLFRLLAQVGDEELRRFADETLGPVLRLNDPERSEMLSTLEALVSRNMNMAETARHLHFHYNTLRYRLSKLERLLGPFSTSTTVTVRVCVALQIMEMQSSMTRRRS